MSYCRSCRKPKKFDRQQAEIGARLLERKAAYRMADGIIRSSHTLMSRARNRARMRHQRYVWRRYVWRQYRVVLARRKF